MTHLNETSASPLGHHQGQQGRRRLIDLVSVGPATVADLALLGIHTVDELARHEPADLYHQLCERTGVRHDPCCLDVFSAAVAQARDPELPAAEKLWWTWSRRRRSRGRDLARS
jgi:hypothetical protein